MPHSSLRALPILVSPREITRWIRLMCAVVCVAVTSLASVGPVRGEPISWMEDFALAPDREAILSELIPGSDDYYFYHCLHFQLTGQLERSEAIIRDWLTEHKGRETASLSAMIDRQRLLTYRQSPQRTIDHLVKRLGVRLDHAPPATKNERRFPSQLDVALLQTGRVVDEALRSNDTLKPKAIEYLAKRFRESDTAGIRISLTDLLNQVSGPYVEDLDQLVAKELGSRRKGEQRFGDRAAHRQLTLAQLRSVAKSVPEIADDNEFVAAVLRRMRPGADEDPSNSPQRRLEYLRDVEDYLQTLPPSYNSMKASAAFRLMEANWKRGVFDRELFLRYLKLPRQSPIILPEFSRRGAPAVNLGDNFMDVAMLPPIGNEEPIVRAHLEAFLKDAETSDAFKNYLKPDYLRRVFAETKLLYGVGDEQRWYRMLSASQRQAIRDRIEMRLSPTNPERYSVDEPAALQIDLKNVNELVVRIYELNTRAYYRTHDQAIDTDIDLDGLVATSEKSIRFSKPAVERHRERIELPELEGRGVWVIDLVGEGRRSRALVRRGAIDHVDSFSADGMVYTIIDEHRNPIPAATMQVGSRQFVADDQGRIVLPPVVDNVSRRAILSDGKIAEQLKFRHLREKYRLEAGIHVDPTQLLSGGRAELLVRPRLMLGQTPIDPATLSELVVRIEATDLSGVPITHQIDDLRLDQNSELVVPIRVPPRLATLRVVLTGKIARIADEQQLTLQAQKSWDLGGVRRISQIHDALLTRDRGEFVVEVRGRNGELIPTGTVNLSLSTNLRQSPINVTLQADQDGRVRLGALSGVTDLSVSVPGGLLHHHNIELNRVRWPNVIHTTVNHPIQLPLPDDEIDPAQRYRLLEVREGRNVSDLSELLSENDGLLSIQTLDAGDYQLIDRDTGQATSIAVVDGPEIDDVAVGNTRHRQISAVHPLSIAKIAKVGDDYQIHLAGDTEDARVHVYASTFLGSVSPMRDLDLPLPRLLGRRVFLPRCGYVSELRLGDEYQYVLRRRYADKYPGVMLPQPGIILNPWETEETTNASQAAASGEAPPPSSDAPAARPEAAMAKQSQSRAASGVPDFDFLGEPGVLLANLRPNADGVVVVPIDAVQNLSVIQVLACDAATMVQRTIDAELEPIKTVDLRLPKSLDPAKSMSLERAVSIASPDKPLDLKELGSAQLQVYGSVSDLFKLYRTMIDDERLGDFDLLANWGALDQDEKLDAYSRLASHELHVFLWYHDRSFFDRVIAPYLANKQEKQFIDHWLLGDDLTLYTDLWRYNQLNAAQRALLAIRLPEMRERVERDLTDSIDSSEPNLEKLRKGIEIALSRQRLDVVEESLMERSVQFDDYAKDSAVSRWQSLGENRESLRRLEAKQEAESLSLGLADKMARGAKRRFLGRSSGGMGGAMGGGMGAFGGRAFFRELDSTKQWAESDWDRVRVMGGPDPSKLIDINAFWADCARQESGNPAVSPHLLLPTENRHAALMALAMSGLPLTAGDIELPNKEESLYKPEHAVALVTKRLRELDAVDKESSILIGQRFGQLNPPQTERGVELPTELSEFLTGVGYRGQVVLSNPTSRRQTVEVFWQIPAGSLALSGQQETDSRTLVLEPFDVASVEYHFYFPAAGEFAHYPATVANKGKLIAKASTKTFQVLDEPTDSDLVTWKIVSDRGTPEQVAEFLADANLREIDWLRIAHRMKDRAIYDVVTRVLRDANLPVAELWAYGFVHQDEPAIRTYLDLRADLVSRVGPVLKSPLLDVDPVQRRTYELLEYAPLVRARIHRLGQEDEIMNATFLAQYERFLRVLGFREQIPEQDRLVLAYYLLIQNRISAAIDQFSQIDENEIAASLQYDYMDAYLALHRGQYDDAEKIANRHEDHPIPRWNNRFGQLLSQLRQRRDLNQTEKLVSADSSPKQPAIEEGSGDLALMDRELQQADAAREQPEVIVKVEGDVLRIDHRNAKQATLNFYGVDLELLFSKAPFVREGLQRMAMVRPTESRQLEFDGSSGRARVDLDGNLRRQTLLVEVVSGASRSTALYYGGDLTTYVSESYGQLQVSDSQSGRPVRGAYVKVYARRPSGAIRFHKDGYTDLRGRFDYASVSAGDAKDAIRYAILVKSDEQGATLHDVAAPNQ